MITTIGALDSMSSVSEVFSSIPAVVLWVLGVFVALSIISIFFKSLRRLVYRLAQAGLIVLLLCGILAGSYLLFFDRCDTLVSYDDGSDVRLIGVCRTEGESSSKNEKKPKPSPSQPKEEMEGVVQAPTPLKQELPEKESAAFKEKVAKGKKLLDDGINAPRWAGYIDTWMIDHLQKEQKVRLFVKTANKIFVFTGGLTKPGDVIEVVEKNKKTICSGLSMRGIIILSKRARNLFLKLKADEFQSQAFALFSVEIDAMILAAQGAAARKVRLDLEDVEETKGRFEQRGGLLFDYKVSKIKTREGKWLNL